MAADIDLIQESLYEKNLVKWQELPIAYLSKDRHYHNLEHISGILEWIPVAVNCFGLSDSDERILHTIAWHHDLVYVPGDSQNERISANIFDARARATKLLPQTQAIIYDAIMDTVTHKSPSSWLSAIFIDLDLEGLRDKSKYTKNSFKVKKEFSNISEITWINGRLKFIEEFLSRPTIFQTALFPNGTEQARANLIDEKNFLKDKLNTMSNIL